MGLEYLVEGKTEAQWRRVAAALEQNGDKVGAEKALAKANARIAKVNARIDALYGKSHQWP